MNKNPIIIKGAKHTCIVNMSEVIAITMEDKNLNIQSIDNNNKHSEIDIEYKDNMDTREMYNEIIASWASIKNLKVLAPRIQEPISLELANLESTDSILKSDDLIPNTTSKTPIVDDPNNF